MKNNAGMTLIEVLVALAILAIAVTAIIKATSQNIKDNIYLQNKITANWVATQVINEARANVLSRPNATGQFEDETLMLNRTWHWQADITDTKNLHVKKIQVTVSLPNSEKTLADLESYFYVP